MDRLSIGGQPGQMLSGFNTNFRYRGVLFHVQTEDSGVENPHVITHLFHGGNIMASEKRDYSELLTSEDAAGLEAAVRKLMEGLHKSMLKQLSRGEHDAAIVQRLGEEIFEDVTGGETHSDGLPSAISGESSPAPAEPSVAPDASPPAPAPAPTPAPAMASAPASAGSAGDEAGQEAARPRVSQLSRVFGERVVSEKPLDEVVLDYLVENARKRKRPSK